MVEFWESFSGLKEPEDVMLVELGACALAFGDGELPFDPRNGSPVPERLGDAGSPTTRCG